MLRLVRPAYTYLCETAHQPSAQRKQHSPLTTHNMPKQTPWTRIYVLILLYNAILVVLFFMIRHYFNID